MKLVIHDLVVRIGYRGRHSAAKRLVEVHGHVLDRFAHSHVQLFKPMLQKALAVSGNHVFDHTTSRIADDCGVAPSAPAFLVDGQPCGEGQRPVRSGLFLARKATIDGAMGDAPQTVNARPKKVGGSATRADQHGINGAGFKQQGELGFRSRPRHGKLKGSVLVAVHTRNGAFDDGGHLAGIQVPPATQGCVVVKSSGPLTSRARQALARVRHANDHFAVDLIDVDLGHLPRGGESKDSLVELSAVHTRKLPPENPGSTACSTHSALDPEISPLLTGRL